MPTVLPDAQVSTLIAVGGFLAALIGGVIAKVQGSRKAAREPALDRETQHQLDRIERAVLRNQDMLENNARIQTAMNTLRDK